MGSGLSSGAGASVNRRGLASLLILLLSIGALSPLAGAQQSPPPPVQALVASSLAKVASIRGLPSPQTPPPVVIRSRIETRRFVEQEMSRKYPSSRLEAERKAMVAWGLIPADFDLRGFLIDLLNEQAVAYYDPTQKVMVLGDWLKPEEQATALVHELVHALQDRQIPVDQFLAPDPGKGDQLLARQALLEGEAVAISLELLLQAQGLDLARIPALSGIQQLATALSAGPVFARAPKFLQDLLLFPYIQGLIFVHQFRLKHSWVDFGQLYRDPPRSTTQLLHPEKFFGRREDPVLITLPDLRPILAPAWHLVSEDEMGEWSLRAALEGFLGEATAHRLAEGWRGDRYQIWEDDRGQLGLIYRVVWEAEERAEAFAQAYAGLLEKKHPALAGKMVKGPGSHLRWQDGSHSFLVERRGPDVVVLERVPTAAEKPIQQALWSSAPAPLPVR